MSSKKRIIISGGGTGGHIYPAVSIANELKRRLNNPEILFVGALGRMEMERVPNEGYHIIGLPVMGLYRKKFYKNFRVLWMLYKSVRKAKKIIEDFKPDIAIGVGGYASGPLLLAASNLGVPTLIQEQNSYAGITNKWLSKRAKVICVAYAGMERFFSSGKIVLTGNPTRQNLFEIRLSREEAIQKFKLDPEKKTILILGGSLGARTMNNSMISQLDNIINSDVQFIWQTGKLYYDKAKNELDGFDYHNVFMCDFIKEMDLAYRAADLVISRAGAGTISELCNLGKPCILIPSPNVSEDHQTKNAHALVERNAAIMIPDREAPQLMIKEAMTVVKKDVFLLELSENIRKLGIANSAEKIVDEVITIINSHNN